jgi:hypothetical protein
MNNYNKRDILNKQGKGVDGGCGRLRTLWVSMHPVGYRRDTRRGCETARAPRSLVYANYLKFMSTMNISERLCNVISNSRRHLG